MSRTTGRCECGAVAFSIPTTALRPTVTQCHCSQCRRTSGHVWASTYAPFDALNFTDDAGLTWFASSAHATRGFCNHCGSSLFYRSNDEEGVGIAAGCLDDTTGLLTGKHIHVADKGTYYEIADGAPQFDTY